MSSIARASLRGMRPVFIPLFLVVDSRIALVLKGHIATAIVRVYDRRSARISRLFVIGITLQRGKMSRAASISYGCFRRRKAAVRL